MSQVIRPNTFRHRLIRPTLTDNSDHFVKMQWIRDVFFGSLHSIDKMYPVIHIDTATVTVIEYRRIIANVHVQQDATDELQWDMTHIWNLQEFISWYLMHVLCRSVTKEQRDSVYQQIVPSSMSREMLKHFLYGFESTCRNYLVTRITPTILYKGFRGSCARITE